MSVWNWIQLVVAIIATLVSYLGKGMNKWLGYAMILGAGGLIIGMSIYQQDYRFLGFGILAIIFVIVAVIFNYASEGKADDDTLGGQISNLPDWVTWAGMGLFVIAIIPCFVLKAPVNESGKVPQTGQSQQELAKRGPTKPPSKTPPKQK